MTETLLSTAIPMTVNGHTFRMVPVEGGEFDMGDEVGDLLERRRRRCGRR